MLLFQLAIQETHQHTCMSQGNVQVVDISVIAFIVKVLRHSVTCCGQKLFDKRLVHTILQHPFIGRNIDFGTGFFMSQGRFAEQMAGGLPPRFLPLPLNR